MKFKLQTINSTKTSDQPADAVNHLLHFLPVAPQGDMGSMITGSSSVTLALTEAQAATYTLGNTYTLSLTPEAT